MENSKPKSIKGIIVIVILILVLVGLGVLAWVYRDKLTGSAATITPTPSGMRNGLGFSLVHDISTIGWVPTPSVPAGQYYTLLDEPGTGNKTDYITSASTGSNNAVFLLNPNTYGAGAIDSIYIGFSAKPKTTAGSTAITVNINPSGTGWQKAQTINVTGDWKGYVAKFTGSWTMEKIMTLQVKLTSSNSPAMIDTLGGSASYLETSFKPDLAATRATMADAVGRAWKVTYQPKVDFKDVQPAYWAYVYIEGCYQKGWVKGYGDGTFRPDTNATRADVAVIISRAAGIAPYDNPTPSFKDVPKTYWAYKEIEGMKKAGMINGYGDGTYRPDNAATRADLAVLVYRGKKITTKSQIPEFLDVPLSYWAFNEVTWIGYLNNFMRP